MTIENQLDVPVVVFSVTNRESQHPEVRYVQIRVGARSYDDVYTNTDVENAVLSIVARADGRWRCLHWDKRVPVGHTLKVRQEHLDRAIPAPIHFVGLLNDPQELMNPIAEDTDKEVSSRLFDKRNRSNA